MGWGGFVLTDLVFGLICLANNVTRLEIHVKATTMDWALDLCSLRRVKLTGPKGQYICELDSIVA